MNPHGDVQGEGVGAVNKKLTWSRLHLQSQQHPSFTLWNGRWKHLPIQSQSALACAMHALNGNGSLFFFCLLASELAHAEPSCLQHGLLPATKCLMDQAITVMMSSKVLPFIAWSGRMTKGILILPFLPESPGRFKLIITTDSVLS